MSERWRTPELGSECRLHCRGPWVITSGNRPWGRGFSSYIKWSQCIGSTPNFELGLSPCLKPDSGYENGTEIHKFVLILTWNAQTLFIIILLSRVLKEEVSARVVTSNTYITQLGHGRVQTRFKAVLYLVCVDPCRIAQIPAPPFPVGGKFPQQEKLLSQEDDFSRECRGWRSLYALTALGNGRQVLGIPSSHELFFFFF